MAVQRIALTQPIESRDGTFAKDSRSVNCVFETRDQKREFVKRPGLVMVEQLTPVTPPAVLESQGLADFNNLIISVVADEVRSTDPNTYITTDVGTMTTSATQSWFARTFNEAYLFIQNTGKGYLLSKAGVFGEITNDKIFTVNVDNGGLNYSEGITLTFSAAGVAAYATVITGSISYVTITNPGSGLIAAPTCTIVKPSSQTPTGTGTLAFFTVTVSSGTGIYNGMYVTGSGIAPNAYVTNVSGTAITLSLANVGSVSGTLTFADIGSNGVLTPALSTFPTGPFVAGAVFMDNYLFIGTLTNRIYNSAPGDPTSWGALDYLSFEQTADKLVGICRHLNYLVAFGERSTQFYYDAANPVGSPLAASQSYTSEIGCASGPSIVSTDNTVLWIGTSRIYGKSVYMMDGVSPVRVSTSSIEKHLEADSLVKVNAFCHKYNGHVLYILTLHDTLQTLVYDISQKMWYEWTQWAQASSYEPNPGTFYESYFRPTFYAEVLNTGYCLEDNTATLYYMDKDVYTDDNEHIYCRTVTDIVDNGSTHRKFYGRLEIIGDKVAGTMQVRHSGDDYNTWSGYRSVDLNASRSQVYLSGSDRRRAWEFLCLSDVPLRLDAAEIEFKLGEMDQEQGTGGGGYRK